MKDHKHKALISQSKRFEKIIAKATMLQFINIYITIWHSRSIYDIKIYEPISSKQTQSHTKAATSLCCNSSSSTGGRLPDDYGKVRKNHAQARVSHDLLHDCRNQKLYVPLEVGGAGAWGGGARVEVGPTEWRRSNFEQSDPRASSILEKDTTKIVNGTLGVVALELVTKKKNGKQKEKGEKSPERGGEGNILNFFFFFFKGKNLFSFQKNQERKLLQSQDKPWSNRSQSYIVTSRIPNTGTNS